MQIRDLNTMLHDSAGEVLESMFFTNLALEEERANGADDSCEPQCEPPCEPWIAARLSFHGNPSGRFGVRTPIETGRKVASNFFGVDEHDITDAQIEEVIGELANMICGSVLSRLEKDTRFALSHPESGLAESGFPSHTASRDLQMLEGRLGVWLDLKL